MRSCFGRPFRVAATFLTVVGAAANTTAHADENGVSFWLPGLFGSLAAAPQVPGWSFAAVNYYGSVSATGAAAASREVTIGRFTPNINVNLNATVKADLDLILANPTYTFATPVLGGQFTVGMMGFLGHNATSVNGTLTAAVGGIGVTRQGSISDEITSVGDLYPQAMLRWNSGTSNWMVYGTGDIPVGAYNSNNLAKLGIGHGAVDAGVGYTYFDPQTGREFSAVTGLTYNLINPSTNYQNGVDWHLDWGASQFLSKTMLVGAVGYVYDQISADKGCLPQLCPFLSRVVGLGPQVGFIFPSATMQTYLNLKAYWEFDGMNRPSGFNAWLTLSFSPPMPGAATSSSSPMLTKAPPRS
jgi:hypothetical protein